MRHVAIASADPDRLETFARRLSGMEGVTVALFAGLDGLRAALAEDPPGAKRRAVVLDQELVAGRERGAVMDLLMLDATLQVALLTDMETESFHEAFEGLGLLEPLPLAPGPEDAQVLVDLLDQLS